MGPRWRAGASSSRNSWGRPAFYLARWLEEACRPASDNVKAAAGVTELPAKLKMS